MNEQKSPKMTQEQHYAIYTTGGGVTVSAAAGSGKTWVLVERVINMLTNERIPADRLLVLTFTKTAAAEMKKRISDSLEKLINSDPANEFYRRQQMLLQTADICTIDTFCSKVVRENHFHLGVSRDFRIETSTSLDELKKRLMTEIIEESYDRGEKDEEFGSAFNSLSMMLTSEKLDSELEKELLDAYDKYTSHAFPELWMNQSIAMYSPETDKETLYNIYAESIRDKFQVINAYYERALTISDSDTEKSESYWQTVKDTSDKYGKFLSDLKTLIYADKINIDKISSCVSGFEKISLRSNKNYGEALSAVIENLKQVPAYIETLKTHTGFTESIFKDNNKQLYPVVKCLAGLLKEFHRRFFEAKCEKGILDFHDLEALVLKLLYDYDETTGEYKISEFGKEFSERYEQIMVDEYQDTNDIQEKIFSAISKNEENLFVVGDIKQSIFRFREARPVLFRNRCEKSKIYNDKQKEFPALIVLDKNFRSRADVIESANYIFGLLMSKKSAEIEYDSTQALSTGADYYPDNDGDNIQLHIIDYNPKDVQEGEEDVNLLRNEAAYCAVLVEDMMKKYQVYDKDEKCMRNVKYSDFCILMRAVKNRAEVFSREFEKRGIPSYTDTEFDLLKRYEVKALISCLKVMNNPRSDKDVLAALMCPVFGFTPDELVEIKSIYAKGLYKRMLRLRMIYEKQNDADNTDDYEDIDLTDSETEEENETKKYDIDAALAEKVILFLETMHEFRYLAVTYPADKLVQLFMEKTDFMAVMSAMPDGEFRVQNLRRFLGYVSDLESSSAAGLTGLIRNIRYIEENDKGIMISDSASVNAVKIMTIHHSKGLEFPICILANTNNEGQNDKDKIKFHSELGVGMRYVDTEKGIKYDTLQFKAIKALKDKEEKSELLRLLYVALTRPREKLIILTSVDNRADKSGVNGYKRYLGSLVDKIIYDKVTGRFSPITVNEGKSFADWLVSCAILNEDMTSLRADAGIPDNSDFPSLKCNAKWSYRHITEFDSTKTEETEESKTEIDTQLLEFLKQRLKPVSADVTTIVPTKVTASELSHKTVGYQFAAVKTPDFDISSDFSAAMKGTAAHNFVEYADFNVIKDEGGIQSEIERIIKDGYMTKDEAALIDNDSIRAFVDSRLFSRIINSKAVYREKEFTVNIPIDLFMQIPEGYVSNSADNETMLQGAMDCIFEEDDGLVIVDYKTDRVKTPHELIKRHAPQLRLYREAAVRIFEKPVKALYIYSFHLGQEIEVPLTDK